MTAMTNAKVGNDKDRFTPTELAALRSDLLQGGMIDSYEAAELLQVFLMGRGYGVSAKAALDAAGKQDLYIARPGEKPVALTDFPVNPGARRTSLTHRRALSVSRSGRRSGANVESRLPGFGATRMHHQHRIFARLEGYFPFDISVVAGQRSNLRIPDIRPPERPSPLFQQTRNWFSFQP